MTERTFVTAYGRAALEMLHREVRAAKAADPMAPVTVVVPNNIAGIVARRHLASQGPGVTGLKVTTLPRLAEQLAAHTLHPRRPATTTLLAAAWRTALARPGLFAEVADHPATIRALVAAHHELRDLSQAALAEVGRATALAGDVVRLHQQVTTTLAPRWYDSTDLLQAATALLTGPTAPARHELGTVVLYLPQHLGRVEAEFARALGASDEPAQMVVIAGLTGVLRADRAVRETLERLGRRPADNPPRPPVATRVMHASDSDDEVRSIVREVVDTLTTTPAHRVAVLYTAAQPYARLVHDHLSRAGITVNGPATRAVHERAVARGMLALLELPGRDFPRAATFRALAEAPVRGSDARPVPVARWERVSRMAGVAGGGDWDQRLSGYAERQEQLAAELAQGEDPRPGLVERAQRESEAARELHEFITELRNLLERGARLRSWPDLSDWALELFHRLYGPPEELTRLPAEEQYAATVIDATLGGLALLGEVEATADLGRLVEVLDLALESALPRVGRFGEGMFVGPVSAAVGMDLDTVFVVGLSEDIFPGRSREDALLGRRVRAATGELRAARDRLDTKHRHLLAAFAAAGTVVAGVPRGDLRQSSQRLPSRWLLHSLRERSGNRTLAATDWLRVHYPSGVLGSPSFAHGISTTAHPASDHEWRVRAAAGGAAPSDPVVAAALQLQRARASRELTRFDGNLTGVAGLPDLSDGQRRTSPTALEGYADCPHAYFVRRLLRVEPVEEPEEVLTISPLQIGNFIHECVDRLVREADDQGTLPDYGQPWTDAHRRRLQEIGTELAEEFAAQGLTGHPRLWEQERPRLLADLEALLDQDDTWRAQRNARVRRSELVFGREGTAPVTIELPAGGAVNLTGSADRVDELPDGTLVVTDIKTGRAARFRVIEQDPIAAGTKLQLPVYAHAARQLLADDPATPVEARYWFVRDTPRFIPLTLDAEMEQRYATALQTLVRSIAAGLFPAKPPAGPSYGYIQCPYCDPDGRGHGELRGRYEVKRDDPALTELVGLIDPEGLSS